MIYFLRAEGTEYVKIGFCRDTEWALDERIKMLQTGCPQTLVVEGTIAHGTLAGEHELHLRLTDRRFRGEWFRLTLDEVLEHAAAPPPPPPPPPPRDSLETLVAESLRCHLLQIKPLVLLTETERRAVSALGDCHDQWLFDLVMRAKRAHADALMRAEEQKRAYDRWDEEQRAAATPRRRR